MVSSSASSALALMIVALIFSRLRTMPVSAISSATLASSYDAIVWASKWSNAARKLSRLLRMVDHDKPDWNASRVSRSKTAASPVTGIPHSVSW